MNLQFTGEYCIPGQSPQRMVDDHMERYRFAAQFVNRKMVLDIACGAGYGTKFLAEAGALQAEGVDISAEVVDYAVCHYKTAENLSFLKGDICRYNTAIPYDVITCFETIEHVADHRQALQNLYALLKSDGVLLISSPNRLITSPRAKSVNDKPRNKHHVREFTPEELSAELVEHGFRVKDIFGQRQQRYYRNKYLSALYTKLFKPKERTSPVLSKIAKLAPRYFVIVAEKSPGKKIDKQGEKNIPSRN
jgi:2-polyprenyl-3-methyl-5-hydroxy-6-metoxy-1,4-benzoquinol methylase